MTPRTPIGEKKMKEKDVKAICDVSTDLPETSQDRRVAAALALVEVRMHASATPALCTRYAALVALRNGVLI